MPSLGLSERRELGERSISEKLSSASRSPLLGCFPVLFCHGYSQPSRHEAKTGSRSGFESVPVPCATAVTRSCGCNPAKPTLAPCLRFRGARAPYRLGTVQYTNRPAC